MSSQPAEQSFESPEIPMPRIIEYEWMSVDTWRGLHAEHCAVAARGCVDVLFLGDSLTQG